jgi:hypothetical protein
VLKNLMTTVAQCSNPAEAMLLKSLLESSGIPAYTPDELTTQAAVHYAASGIRVQVDDENAEQARALLAEAEIRDDAEPDEEDGGESERA